MKMKILQMVSQINFYFQLAHFKLKKLFLTKNFKISIIYLGFFSSENFFITLLKIKQIKPSFSETFRPPLKRKSFCIVNICLSLRIVLLIEIL